MSQKLFHCCAIRILLMTFIKPFCHFFNLDEGRNESIRRKEYENSSKPLLNFRFPVQEDLYLSSKLENSRFETETLTRSVFKLSSEGCAMNPLLGSVLLKNIFYSVLSKTERFTSMENRARSYSIKTLIQEFFS